MQSITSIDTAVFYAINHVPHGWFLDGFFSIVSGLGDSGFIWFVIGIWLILREERRDKRFFLPLCVTGVLSWFFSEVFIKAIAHRIRPSNILDNVIVVGFPNGYSFPSTHTTFAFALAVILSYKEPKLKKIFFVMATLIGFSRIYLGYHYPGDVIAGGVLGWLIGFVVAKGYHEYIKKRKVSPHKKLRTRGKRRK